MLMHPHVCRVSFSQESRCFFMTQTGRGSFSDVSEFVTLQMVERVKGQRKKEVISGSANVCEIQILRGVRCGGCKQHFTLTVGCKTA